MLAKGEPLHAQILLFGSWDDFPGELNEALAKAIPYRVTKFTPGCYRHHFSHQCPLHDGCLLIVGFEWRYASFFLPNVPCTADTGGSGTRALKAATLICTRSLGFLVSEDCEMLAAVQQGKM